MLATKQYTHIIMKGYSQVVQHSSSLDHLIRSGSLFIHSRISFSSIIAVSWITVDISNVKMTEILWTVDRLTLFPIVVLEYHPGRARGWVC